MSWSPSLATSRPRLHGKRWNAITVRSPLVRPSRSMRSGSPSGPVRPAPRGPPAANDANEIGGQFDLTLTAKPNGDVKSVEKAADEELQKFLKEGPTGAELQLVKTRILAQYTRVVERIGGFGGKSDLLARCQTYTGNPDCYKEYLKWIKPATPAAVKGGANDWLPDGDYVPE